MGGISDKLFLLGSGLIDWLYDPAGKEDADAKKDKKAENTYKSTVAGQVIHGGKLVGDVHKNKKLIRWHTVFFVKTPHILPHDFPQRWNHSPRHGKVWFPLTDCVPDFALKGA